MHTPKHWKRKSLTQLVKKGHQESRQCRTPEYHMQSSLLPSSPQTPGCISKEHDPSRNQQTSWGKGGKKKRQRRCRVNCSNHHQPAQPVSQLSQPAGKLQAAPPLVVKVIHRPERTKRCVLQEEGYFPAPAKKEAVRL